jgi:hypothetical protein
MNFSTLSSVTFGDKDALKDFLFENYTQHELFRSALFDLGINCPAYPIADVDVDDLDSWMLMHQNEHQFFSAVLNLENPFNMLDADFRKEDDFYEWISQHYLIHEQIAATLGLSS